MAKIGDRVKVKDDTLYHENRRGQEGIIIELPCMFLPDDPRHAAVVRFSDGVNNCFSREELLIRKKI